MSLDDFKTGNYSSKGSNTQTSSKTKQKDLSGSFVSGFVEKWNMSRSAALRDGDWINSRIDDGWTVNDFCDELNILPRTMLESFKLGVEKGYIDIDDIPDVDDEKFNNQHASWYVEQAIKHKQLPYVASDNTNLIEDNSIDLPRQFVDGIGGYNAGRVVNASKSADNDN